MIHLAASSRRRARPGVEPLGDRVLPSGAGGPDPIINLNEPVGVAAQVQAVFAGDDPVGGAGQALPWAHAPDAVVVYEGPDGQVRVTLAGTPAVVSRFVLKVQETQARPLPLALEEFAGDGATRVWAPGAPRLHPIAELLSDNPRNRILLLLGQGDGPIPVVVGDSFAHLEGAVVTTHFGLADETLVFDFAHLHKEHGGEGNGYHAEGWGWVPAVGPGRLTQEAGRHLSPAPSEGADEPGAPEARGEGALAPPAGKPDGPGSTANGARAPEDDLGQPGPAGAAAGTAEVDVGAEGREAAMRLTPDGNLPAAQVDLVPLRQKDLAVVATFLAGPTSHDGGPGTDPGRADEPALSRPVIGLGPVSLGDRGGPGQEGDGAQGDAVGQQPDPEPAPGEGGPAAPPVPAGAYLPGQGPGRPVAAAASEGGALPEVDGTRPDLLDGLLPHEGGGGVTAACALLGIGALLAWRRPGGPPPYPGRQGGPSLAPSGRVNRVNGGGLHGG
jgi:hypothetical protein